MSRVARSAASSSVSAEAMVATTSAVSTTGFDELQVAADVDPQGDAPRDLDAGAADLAVAHGGVQVAGGQQRAGRGDRQIHHRALADEPRVHVAAVRAGRAARHRRARRRDADDADHRPHGHLEPAGQTGDARPSIGTISNAVAGIRSRKHAELRAHRHHALRRHLDALDEHREHVAGLRRPPRTRARWRG